MSYDLFFFRPKQGHTFQDCEAALLAEIARREEEDEDEEEDDEDDEDDEENMVELEPLDPTFEPDDINPYFVLAYLSATVPEAKRSPALQRYLGSKLDGIITNKDLRKIPEYNGEWDDEWGVPEVKGVCVMDFSYSGLDTLDQLLLPAIQILAKHNIYAFDPQLEAVIDPDNAQELLLSSLRECKQTFDEIISGITSGQIKLTSSEGDDAHIGEDEEDEGDAEEEDDRK